MTTFNSNNIPARLPSIRLRTMISSEPICNEHTWLTFDRAKVQTASDSNAYYKAEPEPGLEMSHVSGKQQSNFLL